MLEEIEKAGDEIFDIFLNIFEKGRHTDPLGRVTSFQSCLIAMTSNLGGGNSGMPGFAENETREDSIGKVDRSAITGIFRAKFFNRLDQLVYFDPLNKEAIEENLILPLARWLSGELIPDKAIIAIKPIGDNVSFRTIRT